MSDEVESGRPVEVESGRPVVTRSGVDQDVAVHRRQLSLSVQLPGGEMRLAIEDPTEDEANAVLALMQVIR